MLVCELEKNTKERIRVSIETYRGSMFVDLRVYWQDKRKEWRPSRKGIALNGGSIQPVIEALEKASAKLEEAEMSRAFPNEDLQKR